MSEGAEALYRKALNIARQQEAKLWELRAAASLARLLRDQKYNLRVNVKRLTGPPHPDRDRQFRHIREKIDEFRAEGWPVLGNPIN